MKQQISPGVAAVIIVVVIAVAGFLFYRGAQGDAGTKPAGAVGNSSPFAPGGAALGQGANPQQGGGGNPNQPRMGSPSQAPR